MSNPIPRIECGDTRKFLVVFSATPSTPVFTISTGSGDGAVIATPTVITSSTAAQAFFTFPNSRLLYTWMWVGSFSDGAVVFRGYVQAIKTIPG